MPFCSNCGNLINNNTLFCPKCGNRVGVIINIQRQDAQPFEQKEQKPFKPNSNMALAILTTVLCCVPLGVYAITLANKIDTLYYYREYQKAEMAAQDAKKWSIIGMTIGFITWIVYIIIVLGIIGGESFQEGFWEGLREGFWIWRIF